MKEIIKSHIEAHIDTVRKFLQQNLWEDSERNEELCQLLRWT